jgi:hypothetical protein
MTSMPSGPTPVFLDTSYIRQVGFNHPDFQKLIEYSKTNQLRLFVSFIAWEERRTQLLVETRSQVMKVTKEFNTLCRQQPTNFILKGLAAPVLNLWNQNELEERSHEEMSKFAKDSHITIVQLGPDHGERAWRRYFQHELPFNPDEPDREKRRKDIPDSWILEAAIDVKREHSTLIVLCNDKRFSTALKQVLAVPVFEEAQDVLDHIDRTAQSPKITNSVRTTDSASIQPTAESGQPNGALTAVFNEAESQFRMVGTKIIGLVAYLGAPTKNQIYTILERSGIPPAVARNVAEQLTLGKIILDTGHHYISGKKDVGDQAKAAVEQEIIRLITDPS